MAQFTVDLSGLPMPVRERIHKVLHREDEAKLALAKVEQARLARALRTRIGPGTSKPGIGPMSMAMVGYFANYWRHKKGQDWAQDEDFCRWLCKRDPWFAVPQTGTRMQVGYQPTASAVAVQPSRKIKERITYA